MTDWSVRRRFAACLAALLMSANANAALLRDAGEMREDPALHEQVRQMLLPVAQDWQAPSQWSLDYGPSGARGGEVRRGLTDWSLAPSATAGGAVRLTSVVNDQSPDQSPVPLPGALWMLSSGAAALAATLGRRSPRNRASACRGQSAGEQRA